MLVNFCTKNNKKRANKRAFTVVETVVAMAIIVMISAVGIASCAVALKVQNNAVNTEKAYTVCDEVVSAFHQTMLSGSFSETEFVRRVQFAVGKSDGLQHEEGSNVYVYADSGFEVTATLDGAKISVVCKIDGLSGSVYNRTFVVQNSVLTEVENG